MTQVFVTVVIGTEKVHGRIDTTVWPVDGSRSEVLVRLDDGRQVMVPVTALNRHEDGSYVVNLPAGEDEGQPESREVEPGQSVVIPVMTEEVDVYTRMRETGRVRVTKTVHEREELIEEPLFREEVIVERVQINRIVEEPIPLRYEGDTIIVSLLEEIPVIEKRLLLKEELRITRRPVERHNPLPVTLRSEEAIVEHIKSQKPENSKMEE